MAEEQKTMVTVDGKEYDPDTMSDNAKRLISNIQYTDAELARLRLANAAMQTARQSYVGALKRELEKDPAEDGSADS